MYEYKNLFEFLNGYSSTGIRYPVFNSTMNCSDALLFTALIFHSPAFAFPGNLCWHLPTMLLDVKHYLRIYIYMNV